MKTHIKLTVEEANLVVEELLRSKNERLKEIGKQLEGQIIGEVELIGDDEERHDYQY